MISTKVAGEKPDLAVQLALDPVLVHVLDEGHDLVAPEGELGGQLGLEGVEGFGVGA